MDKFFGGREYPHALLVTAFIALLVLLGVVAGNGIATAYARLNPHDYDCSAHHGVMPPPPSSPYIIKTFSVVCNDGYIVQ